MPKKENSEKLKRGSTRLALKAGFWYIASNFLIKGLAFITTPIFARLMSRSDYGEFSNYASWQATLIIITGAELYNTLSRAYYDYTDDYDKYTSSVTIAGFGITAAVYMIFLLCGDWIYNIVSIPKQYIHMLFFMLMFQTCKQIYMARERTLYRYKKVAAISIINLIIPTVIAIFFVIMAPEEQRLSARIYGYYIPSALIGMFCGAELINKGRTFNLDYCRYAFKLSLPMLVHYLTAYLLTSTNTIITKSICGAQSAAIVSIASSTIHILTILFQSVSGALTTWLMDNLQQGNIQKVRKGILVYVIALEFVAVSVILFAPEIVWLLGGNKYTESVFLIPGLVVAVFIQSITSLFVIILTFDKNIVRTAMYTSIVAAFNIITKILFISLYGYQTMPYINIFSFTAMFIINYVLIKKAGYGDAINIKGITGTILLSCLIMFSSIILYNNNLIRYSIVVVLGIVVLATAYKNKSMFISFIKPKK